MQVLVDKLFSGGQTGADQGGWDAVDRLKAAGASIAKTGWMPAGFRTEDGYHPEFKELHGAKEHPSHDYQPRTRNNVVDTQGTIVVGNQGSRGSKLTVKFCKDFKKPCLPIEWRAGQDIMEHVPRVRQWLRDNGVRVLNVAGNRESKNPGVSKAVSDLLFEALQDK